MGWAKRAQSTLGTVETSMVDTACSRLTLSSNAAARDSHLCVACRSICDRNENEVIDVL